MAQRAKPAKRTSGARASRAKASKGAQRAKQPKPAAKATRSKKTKSGTTPRVSRAASSTRSVTAAWTPTTRKGRATGFDACPLCGSTNLDVQRADGPGKAAGKLAVGLVIGVAFPRFYSTATCRTCGWRSEATA